MVILNIEKVNSIEEMISKYEDILNIQKFKCPNCNCSEFNYYGYYIRNVVSINEEGNILEYKIKLKKIKCKNCGMIHAIIPNFLIPYRQYCLKTINKVLEDKIEKEFSNKDIIEKYNISRQLLKKWIDVFSCFKNKLSTLYGKSKNIFKNINDDKIINSFYCEFNEIYLLKRLEKIYVYVST